MNIIVITLNDMEFFGITKFGASDPIKFLLRPDFNEPAFVGSIENRILKGEFTRPFNEIVRDLDLYSGILDGYSYRSYHRLNESKKKGFYKTLGPNDIYRTTATDSMNYGWWMFDPLLNDKKWYKPKERYPKPVSENTRIFDEALLKDKHFTF